MISTTIDNRKWQYGPTNRKYLYHLCVRKCDSHHRNSNGKTGDFDHDEFEVSVCRRVNQRLKQPEIAMAILVPNPVVPGQGRASNDTGKLTNYALRGFACSLHGFLVYSVEFTVVNILILNSRREARQVVEGHPLFSQFDKYLLMSNAKIFADKQNYLLPYKDVTLYVAY